MKSLRKLLYIIPLTGMMVTSCMDVENIEIDHIGGYATMNNEESEAYYANLRAYKATAWNYNRPVAFGWYSNWATAGAYRRGYLSAMPDSMDFVSMWSGAPGRYEITPEQKADKEFVQKVKGTKLLQVSLYTSKWKNKRRKKAGRRLNWKQRRNKPVGNIGDLKVSLKVKTIMHVWRSLPKLCAILCMQTNGTVMM